MSFTQTSTYNAPTLAYPAVSGVTVTGGATSNPVLIPLVLEAYSGVGTRGLVDVVSVMPVILNDNLAYGGVAISEGASELPKLSMSGFIDTTFSGTESLLQINGGGAVWADFIIMCLEGRASTNWQRWDPAWFRDPYGRQFNNPTVFDFNATYVEAVPGRTNFSMTLLVGH